jgi:ribonuclease HI
VASGIIIPTKQLHFVVNSSKTGSAISYVVDDSVINVLPPVTTVPVEANTPAQAHKQKKKSAQIVAVCDVIAAQYPDERFDVYIHNSDLRQSFVFNRQGCRDGMPEGFSIVFGSEDDFRKNRSRVALVRASDSAQLAAAAAKDAVAPETLLTGVDGTVTVSARSASDTPMPDALVIATDASVHGRQSGSGTYAWVTSDGRFGYGNAKHSNVTACELYAILSMLNTVERTENLRILVDSQAALQLIKSGVSKNSTVPLPIVKLAEQIRVKLNSYQNTSLEWVKGHNGHPLNDAADRIARNARLTSRQNQVKQAKAQRGLRSVAQRIVNDAMVEYKNQVGVLV